MALQSLVRQFGSWLAVAVGLLVPGLVATLLWAPFLVVKRIRTLFTALPPTNGFVLTYVLVTLGASIPFVAGFVGTIVFVDPAGAAWSNALFTLTLLLFGVYSVGLPVVSIFGLPRVGIHWDPTGYGWSTWALLVVGSVWYATLFAAPIIVVSIVFALPGGY